MEMYGLFPTPVGVFNLDRELTFKENQYIINLPKKTNTLNLTSVDSYVLNSEVLQDLKSFFDKSLQNYLNVVYNPSTDCSLKITQSWCNYTENQQGHHIHSHQNSIVSGVFYVQTCENDKIRFFTHSSHLNGMRVNPEEYNIFNSYSWWLPSKQCTLILFPSNLQHGVNIIHKKESRISLSFNTFFSGVVGLEGELTQLQLP